VIGATLPKGVGAKASQRETIKSASTGIVNFMFNVFG